MDTKRMLAYVFVSMGPQKHEKAAIFVKNEQISNVFVI